MNNHKIKCTVCEHAIDLPKDVKEGDRVTCPNCFAQLQLITDKGRKQLRCALCGNLMHSYCPPDCERKSFERKKRGFLDIRP